MDQFQFVVSAQLKIYVTDVYPKKTKDTKYQKDRHIVVKDYILNLCVEEKEKQSNKLCISILLHQIDNIPRRPT